jgi:Fur family peroxide stress response transcriptional regulator
VTVSQAEVERRIEAMSQALRDAGLRLTHQRLEIVREISASDEHPDVEGVYRRVCARVPTISLDTVYRTLATLAEHGLVQRVTATAGPARYDANTQHHHHFICTRCGVVRDIDDAALDAVAAPPGAAALGVVESVDVQLRGACAACARKESAARKGHPSE